MVDASGSKAANTSGVSSGIRVTVAILVSIILGLFIFLWDSKVIHYASIGLPQWSGTMVILPLLAVALSFGSNCLMQQLSCSQVQWLVQLKRSAYTPIAFYAMWLILYLFPIIRWPVEGLAQTIDPTLRGGLSSGFYTFWVSMYSQGLLNSMAQICPKI